MKVGGQGTLLRTCCYAVLSHSSPQPQPNPAPRCYIHLRWQFYYCDYTHKCCSHQIVIAICQLVNVENEWTRWLMRPTDRCPGRNTWLPKSLWGCFPLSERKRKGRTDLFGSSTNSWYHIFSWKKFPGQAAKYLVQLENAKEGEDHLCASADRTSPPFRTLPSREKWHTWHPSINSLDCILGFAAVVFTVQLHLLWHDFLSPPPAARSQQWRKAVDGQLRVDNDGHWTVASPPVTTSVKVAVGLHGVCAFLWLLLWKRCHENVGGNVTVLDSRNQWTPTGILLFDS